MNAEQFFNAVASMREAQRTYFRTRSSSSLRESKALERAIDAEIKRVREIKGTQSEPKLL